MCQFPLTVQLFLLIALTFGTFPSHLGTFVNPISATVAVPTTTNMAYIPNSSLVVFVIVIPPKVGLNTFTSRPSMPVKVAQYSNLIVRHGGNGSQFSQSVYSENHILLRYYSRYFAHFFGSRLLDNWHIGHNLYDMLAQYTPVLYEPAYLKLGSPAASTKRSCVPSNLGLQEYEAEEIYVDPLYFGAGNLQGVVFTWNRTAAVCASAALKGSSRRYILASS